MTHVFISYSKQDINVVRALRYRLEKAGIPVWMDERRLSSGDEWWDAIEASIVKACAFIVVMSPNSDDSRWVTRELLIAEDKRLPVFPVLIAGKPWSRLGDLQYEDLRRSTPDALSRRMINTLRRLSGIIDEAHTSRERKVTLRIIEQNIAEVDADVIALKYAKGLHGADRVIAGLLTMAKIVTDPDQVDPDVNEYVTFDTPPFMPADKVLFVGTTYLSAIGYQGIRDWAARVLSALEEAAPDTEHIAMTIHGPGFGLDETEAFRQQIEGVFDAMNADTLPPALKHITVCEFDKRRVGRLQDVVHNLALAIDTIEQDGDDFRLVGTTHTDTPDQQDTFAPVMPERPNAFVVLSDTGNADDLFYFGIQQPTHTYGLLCERVDYSPAADNDTAAPYDFQQIRNHIDRATMVIIDLTRATQFDMLQLGYALGRGRPLLLIAQDADTPTEIAIENDLHVVRYRSIKDVEQAIDAFLQQLVESGTL